MQRKLCLLSFFILTLYFSEALATEYKVVVRAHHGVQGAIKQWTATLALLNKRIPEHHFILVPIRSLALITKGAKSGEFDFVLTNPSSYVELKQSYGALALVTLNNKRANSAHDHFGSVIFTKAENTNIQDLNDLKGKTLMAVSERAFGGWRVAWLEMLEQGINPYRDLKQLLFTNSRTQPEVVWAVYYNKADAGVVRTDRLERMASKGNINLKDFRILNKKVVAGFPFYLSTRLYPEWAFAVLKHVPREDALKVKNVLKSISKDQPAALSGKYIGWIESVDYGSVDKLMKRLQVGPYATK